MLILHAYFFPLTCNPLLFGRANRISFAFSKHLSIGRSIHGFSNGKLSHIDITMANPFIQASTKASHDKFECFALLEILGFENSSLNSCLISLFNFPSFFENIFPRRSHDLFMQILFYAFWSLSHQSFKLFFFSLGKKFSLFHSIMFPGHTLYLSNCFYSSVFKYSLRDWDF